MSQHGIRIWNVQAASIYEYMNGFRGYMDMTKAMLVNSLFLDFLLDHDLLDVQGDSTRSIICLEFGYGTKDYKETKEKIINNLSKENISEESKIKLNSFLENLEKNKDKCVKISRQELREKYYTEGVEITYKVFNKSGNEVRSRRKTIRYKMLYRTPGKAKKGTCMFIDERIYDKVHEFLYMGIKPPQEKAPIVELGAYSSLITSSIEGRIQIKHCYIAERDNYEVVNTLFDGQGLIDESIFPEWGDGYILLRHHMTKLAAFKTRIQQFMQDTFGDEYETATVKDMWGRDVRVKDIKLITTNNAFKWLKFHVSFEYWTSWIRKNGCQFGIVKTAHESKLGDVQRMSYQMMNSLEIESMPAVCSKTVEYINKLKTDNKTFFEYLEKNINFANDYEVLLALCKHNSDFVNSTYFRERRQAIINAYVLNFKNGRSIQDADNLTIVGSPYAMLLHAVGKDPFDDPTLLPEDGTIQCYTERFADGEYLASFRSPQNARNNIGYLHNKYPPELRRYFDLGKLCIAVNMINTDFQSRHNGLTYGPSVQKCA